jgi:hypothetical protein
MTQLGRLSAFRSPQEVNLLAGMGALGTRFSTGGPDCPSWVMSGTATTTTDVAVLPFPAVLLYGIASARSADIEIWSTTRDEADATLAEILRDEPDFEGALWVAFLRGDPSARHQSALEAGRRDPRLREGETAPASQRCLAESSSGYAACVGTRAGMPAVFLDPSRAPVDPLKSFLITS